MAWATTRGSAGRAVGWRTVRDVLLADTENDPDDPGSLSEDTVSALYQDRAGDLWIGTFSGLNRLDPETGATERLS